MVSRMDNAARDAHLQTCVEVATHAILVTRAIVAQHRAPVAAVVAMAAAHALDVVEQETVNSQLKILANALLKRDALRSTMIHIRTS